MTTVLPFYDFEAISRFDALSRFKALSIRSGVK